MVACEIRDIFKLNVKVVMDNIGFYIILFFKVHHALILLDLQHGNWSTKIQFYGSICSCSIAAPQNQINEFFSNFLLLILFM